MRRMINRGLCTLAALAGAMLVSASERPNIVLIMADDMGFSDIGCYGGEIDTPNIDALAEGGVKFSNFYNSGRCCPTRATLMTGLHPHQTGIGWMTGDQTFGHGVDYPGYQNSINNQCVTLAQVLSEAGYATILSGKWHLGYADREDWPLQRGFEQFYGGLQGAFNFFAPAAPKGMSLGNEPVTTLKSTTDRRYYTTDAFTDYAIRFVAEEKAATDRPFFLFLSYNAPHWPLHAHKEEIDKYRDRYTGGWDVLREERLKRQVESGLISADWPLSKRHAKTWDALSETKRADLALRMAYYAAMVDRMDQNIGKLLDHLKATGQYENTLILFLSDNGACQEGGPYGGKGGDPFDLAAWETYANPNASYGGCWANASNTPFRKFKHFTHEGGLATPLLVHWPRGIVPAKKWVRESAYLPDLAQTLYDVAEATYPESYRGKPIPALPGISLVPSFRGEPLARKHPLFFEHEDNAAMYIGDIKLVGSKVSLPEGTVATQWELYDLKKDRTEMNNLAASYPEKVNALAKQWEVWAHQVGVYPKPAAHKSTPAKRKVKGKKK